MSQEAFEIELPGQKKVVLVELKPSQLQQAMQLGGGPTGNSLATAMEGLRLSIREIDGRKVGYNDLAGERLDDAFRTRDVMLLVGVWNEMHFPSEEEAKAILGKAKTIAGSGT